MNKVFKIFEHEYHIVKFVTRQLTNYVILRMYDNGIECDVHVNRDIVYIDKNDKYYNVGNSYRISSYCIRDTMSKTDKELYLRVSINEQHSAMVGMHSLPDHYLERKKRIHKIKTIIE